MVIPCQAIKQNQPLPYKKEVNIITKYIGMIGCFIEDVTTRAWLLVALRRNSLLRSAEYLNK